MNNVITLKRGITLAELMVACAILGMLLVPLFMVLKATKSSVSGTSEETIAVYLAQKVIEDFRFETYNQDSSDFRACLESTKEAVSQEFETLKEQLSVLTRKNYELTVDFGEYQVPGDPDSEDLKDIPGLATVDVDGDNKNDPDAVLVKVKVSWQREKGDTDQESGKQPSVEMATVVAKHEHFPRQIFKEHATP